MLTPEDLQEIFSRRAAYKGLTKKEAAARIVKYGLNVRAQAKRRGAFGRLWSIFTEPMMFLIMAAAVVYFFIGSIGETILFLVAIIPIGLMEFFQEKRTDNAISALDKILVEKCKAYRDGELVDLEIKFLVPGDLVYVTAGDKISADGFLLSSAGLAVDESILTGESVPATKSEISAKDDLNEEHQVRQGTLVAQGEGYMLVTGTGAFTTYGKLGSLLGKIENRRTPLQIKIERLVRLVALGAIVVALFVGVVLSFTRGIIAGFLGGITMAMSLIPEEFPVVFSVFLIMGVLRLAKQNALAREMVMVETLGSATVICSDKTGTLTEGRMSLEKMYLDGKIISRKEALAHPETAAELMRAALLSLERVAVDPIEVEAQNFAKLLGFDLKKFYKDYDLIIDSPFNAKSKMVHHIWRREGDGCVQYTVGAPEMVMNASVLAPEVKKKHFKVYEDLAKDGYRLVAVARQGCVKADDGACPACEAEIKTGGLIFMGFLAMSDPPRAGVKEAVGMCQEAGIRVIMITGDNKLTAHHLADRIGLEHHEEVITGDDLEKMSISALREAVKRRSIFARVRPEQKYAIVEALQKNGEVVAMTGDGVNDAPALKKADIGIAMGKKGTEVARAASGIVLLDDNFASIVGAVKEGRRIYDNLRQAFAFLFSFHLPIIGLAVLPLLFGQSLIFAPIHIIFLEFICDPASVLGFEKEKARRNLMKEPPRPVSDPLVNPYLWKRIIIQGLAIMALSFGLYYYFGMRPNNLNLGRTMAIASLILSQTFLILFSREWEQVKSNTLLLFISFFTVFVLFLLLTVPPLRTFFYFVGLAPSHFVPLMLAPFLGMLTVSVISRKLWHA